jgi:hypothetical protein
VYLSTDASADSFERFLRDHARLLNALPAWTVVIAHPPRFTPPASWTTTFERFVSGVGVLDGIDIGGLERHFRVRRAIEQLDFGAVQLDDLQTYRDRARLFDTPAIESLFARWLSSGQKRLEPASLLAPTGGRLVILGLVHRYEQFGAYAGLV